MKEVLVPYTDKGRGGLVTLGNKKYHVPSWIEVDPETTFDNIVMEENPFKELFIEEKVWEFKSSNRKDVYKVRLGKNGPYCECWGYRSHRKCKHVTEVKKDL